MHFYEVLVSSQQFHGKEPLTYLSDNVLPVGSIVVVPLRNKPVVGVVLKEVGKPSFATKPINKVVTTQPVPTETLALLDWLRHYYPAPLGILAQILLPSSLLRKRDIADAVPPSASLQPTPMPPLIPQQAAAVQQMNQPGTYLLHGDTGTGKTRVYLELAQQEIVQPLAVPVLGDPDHADTGAGG
jgi:primosomal protein N' (replication factor Y)